MNGMQESEYKNVRDLVVKGKFELRGILKKDTVDNAQLNSIINEIHRNIAQAARDKNKKKLLRYSIAEGSLARYAYKLTKEDRYLEMLENAERRNYFINNDHLSDSVWKSIYEMHMALAK